MSIKEIIQQLRMTMDDARGQESHFDSWLTQNEGICKAIDALKILDTPPAAQQEPVAWMDVDGNISDNDDYKCFPIPLYITPNIQSYLEKDNLQRKWVGLTDEDIFLILGNLQAIYNRPQTEDSRIIFAHAIEAKLKELNYD